MATAPLSSNTSELITAANVCPAEAVLELMASLFLTETCVPLGMVARRRALVGRVYRPDGGTVGSYTFSEREALLGAVGALPRSPNRMLWMSWESRVRVAPLSPRKVICEPLFEISWPR